MGERKHHWHFADEMGTTMSEHTKEPWELSQLYPNSGLVLLRDGHDPTKRKIGEFRLREDAQHERMAQTDEGARPLRLLTVAANGRR
jgi:hypothetical protein